MPYKPTELTQQEQVDKWFAENPDRARRLQQAMQQAGVSPSADGSIDFEDPRFAKVIQDNPDLLPFTTTPLQDQKAAYYVEHPDQDPQSMWATLLGFAGLDTPYVNDSRSYDYRANHHDRTPNFTVGPHGEKVVDTQDPAWKYPELPTDEQRQEWWDEFMGRGRKQQEDPRSAKEKASGALLQFLQYPFFGWGDEAAAAASSGLNQANAWLTGDPKRATTYDEELAKARMHRDLYNEYETRWSPTNVAANGAGIVADIFNPAAPWNLMGLGGKAATTLGKVAQTAAMPAATTADMALYASGSSDAPTWEERWQAVEDSPLVKTGAAMGGMMAAGAAAPLAFPAAGITYEVANDIQHQPDVDEDGNPVSFEDKLYNAATKHNIGKGILEGYTVGIPTALGWRGAQRAGKYIDEKIAARRTPKGAPAGKSVDGEPAPIPRSSMPPKVRWKMPVKPEEAPIPQGARPQPSVRDDLDRAIQQSRMRDRG